MWGRTRSLDPLRPTLSHTLRPTLSDPLRPSETDPLATLWGRHRPSRASGASGASGDPLANPGDPLVASRAWVWVTDEAIGLEVTKVLLRAYF